MDLFNHLLSLVIFGVVITMMIVFLAGQLAYFVRARFTFTDPRLGWDPSAGLPYHWRDPGRGVNVDASDWAERADVAV